MNYCPYRIAIRQEGESVNAYFAKTETMEGAELVATIKRSVLELDPRLFDGFQTLMKMVSVAMVEAKTGYRVESVDISNAPEHEKAGRA